MMRFHEYNWLTTQKVGAAFAVVCRPIFQNGVLHDILQYIAGCSESSTCNKRKKALVSSSNSVVMVD